MTTTPFGDYLRSRRAALTPAQVGLAGFGPRRVAGLRREEVALLAQVSVDYYVRLEQGRERNPSPQVLDTLGEALRLDDDGRLHLHRLAGQSPRTSWVGAPERVDPSLLQLMDRWPDTPALVLGRAYDVLASNQLGDALFTGFSTYPNVMLEVFLDPDARAFYADWQRAAASTVAAFRLAHGAWPGAPRIREVLQRLLRDSAEFVELWEKQDARGKSREVKRFNHQDVGALTLHMQTFDVRSSPGQQLVVYSAEPGSLSADGLSLLGSLTADRASSDSDPSR